MASFTIDLMGDDDVIVIKSEEDHEKISRREEEARQRAIEEFFKRSPQPQVVPIEVER